MGNVAVSTAPVLGVRPAKGLPLGDAADIGNGIDVAKGCGHGFEWRGHATYDAIIAGNTQAVTAFFAVPESHFLPNNPRMDLIGWLERGLAKPGKTHAGLAARLGRDASVVSKMLSGVRQIKAAELPVIAAYLEEPEPAGVMPNRPATPIVDEAALQSALASVNEYLDRSGLVLDSATYARVVSQLYKLTSNRQAKPEEIQAATATVIDFAAATRSR